MTSTSRTVIQNPKVCPNHTRRAISAIGTTVLLVLVTALLGSLLLAKQGAATVRRVRFEASEGRIPAKALADGAMLLVAGAFLLTPGLLTEATGLALLVPGVRNAISGWIGVRIQRRWFVEL